MAKFKVKIYEDNKGQYIKLKGKKIYMSSSLSSNDLVKWLIEYLKPKRKRTAQPAREKKEKKEEVKPVASTISTSLSTENEALKAINKEREKLRKETETKRQTPEEKKEAKEEKKDLPLLVGPLQNEIQHEVLMSRVLKRVNKPGLEAYIKKQKIQVAGNTVKDYRDAIIKKSIGKNMGFPEFVQSLNEPVIGQVRIEEVDDEEESKKGPPQTPARRRLPAFSSSSSSQISSPVVPPRPTGRPIRNIAQPTKEDEIKTELNRLNLLSYQELKKEAENQKKYKRGINSEEMRALLLDEFKSLIQGGNGKHRRQRGKGFFGDLYKSAKDKIDKVKEKITDKITDVKDKIVKFFQPRLDSYNNKTRKNLEKYGNIPISNIDVMREPISSYINTFLNGITFGGWDEAKKKVGYDDMFHLGMVVTLNTDQKIKIEKNDVINVDTSINYGSKAEKVTVSLPRQDITINEMFEKGNKNAGNDAWFLYDAFSTNCQNFIKLCLSSVGCYSGDINEFVYQPVEELLKNMPAYAPKITKFITDLGGTVNKITGQGREEERGLSSVEIDKMMKNKKMNGVYLGTTARDKFDYILKKVKPQSRGAFIYNVDNSDLSGSHWRAIFFDARPTGSKSIEMFDSYGDDPSRKDLKELKKLSNVLNSDVLLKLKINKMKLQSDNSGNCGWLCMRFILDRMRGKSFSKATGFDDHLKKMSKVKASEDDVESFKKQFSKFNYV